MDNDIQSGKMRIVFVFASLLFAGSLLNGISVRAFTLATFSQSISNNNSNSSTHSRSFSPNGLDITSPNPSVLLGTNTINTTKSSASPSGHLTTNYNASGANNTSRGQPHVIVINLDRFSTGAAERLRASASNATCGQEAGFPMQVIVNGLAPNATIMWRMVHSNGDWVHEPWGIFITNRTGGFSEPTFIEELPKDKYHLFFFNSVQNESEIKRSDAVASALVTVVKSNSCTP